MLAVPMKTHRTRLLALALAGLMAGVLAGPAAAGDRAGPSDDEVARLEARIEALEARVAMLAEENAGSRSGGEAMARVALIADRAMANLFAVVREFKGAPREGQSDLR